MRIILPLRRGNQGEDSSRPSMIYKCYVVQMSGISYPNQNKKWVVRLRRKGLSAVKRNAFEAALFLFGMRNCFVKAFLLDP